ncbi:MAG: type II secretion system F family protein [Labilithrix sp.]|nr:type II secretion system F family protein [Labilithrix sp.]
MSVAVSSATLLRVGCLVLFGTAASLLGYAVATGETVLSRAHARYVAHLDRSLRLLYRPEIGRRIAVGQASLAALAVAAEIGSGVPYLPLWLGAIAVGPELWLVRARARRVAALEQQVDGFVVALANALKTVPSPAAALQATTFILPQPTRQEIEQVLKEVRVGSSLEEALLAMSARVKSRWIDVAFSAVLIGLRVGGNLPAVLERTASMIREINRLFGVVRTKTSEGRAQVVLLAVFPMFIIGAFHLADPGYFDPLQHSLLGQLCVAVASLLWVASLLVARKIMAVDV